MQNIHKDTNLKNKVTITREEGGGWRINWEIRTDIYLLLYIKLITNKVYSTRNSVLFTGLYW